MSGDPLPRDAFDLVICCLQSAALAEPPMQLHLVHKKVRLSEDLLAWEHERFSIKRYPAATLSALDTHKDPRRSSIFTAR